MKDTERHNYIGDHIRKLREEKGWTQQVYRRGIGYAARVKADDVVVVLEIIGGGALDEILMIYRSTL